MIFLGPEIVFTGLLLLEIVFIGLFPLLLFSFSDIDQKEIQDIIQALVQEFLVPRAVFMS